MKMPVLYDYVLRNKFEWHVVGPAAEPISQDTTANEE
jgi:hypothetical protein